MRYIIEKRYRLCGWDKLPYAVVDRKYAYAHFVSKEDMEALLLCDGKTDFSRPSVPDALLARLEKYKKRGVIRLCEEGEELSPSQKYRLYPSRYMESIHWSVTGRCNSRCKHCYMSAADAKYGELPHEQVMKIIEDMGRCGVLSCSLTGGEALVRSDFWDIIDALIAQDIMIRGIYSNGLLVNERFLEGLKARGLKVPIYLSYDGVGYHDWLRGIDGAETAVRRAFELCQREGFPTGSVMCVWKDNRHVIRDTIRYLESVGCSYFKINMISPKGAWKEGNYIKDYGIPEDEVLDLCSDCLDMFYQDLPKMEVTVGSFFSSDGRMPDEYMIPVFHVCESVEKAKLCAHARNTMYISPEGRAMFCLSFSGADEEFQRQFPLVQEEGIANCLNDSRYQELLYTSASEIFAHNEKCHDCRYQRFCLGGCRATAMSYHSADILSVDEFACRMFREGWIKKIQEKVTRLRPSAKCPALTLMEKM